MSKCVLPVIVTIQTETIKTYSAYVLVLLGRMIIGHISVSNHSYTVVIADDALHYDNYIDMSNLY